MVKWDVKCADTRPCRYRSNGMCRVLTTAYEEDGKCPFCKDSDRKDDHRHESEPEAD